MSSIVKFKMATFLAGLVTIPFLAATAHSQERPCHVLDRSCVRAELGRGREVDRTELGVTAIRAAGSHGIGLNLSQEDRNGGLDGNSSAGVALYEDDRLGGHATLEIGGDMSAPTSGFARIGFEVAPHFFTADALGAGIRFNHTRSHTSLSGSVTTAGERADEEGERVPQSGLGFGFRAAHGQMIGNIADITAVVETRRLWMMDMNQETERTRVGDAEVETVIFPGATQEGAGVHNRFGVQSNIRAGENFTLNIGAAYDRFRTKLVRNDDFETIDRDSGSLTFTVGGKVTVGR